MNRKQVFALISTALVATLAEAQSAYTYESATGHCLDAEGREGWNVARLVECGQLEGATLTTRAVVDSYLAGSHWSQLTWDEAVFKNVALTGSSWLDVRLHRSFVEDSNFEQASIKASQFDDVEFEDVSFEGASLTESNIRGTSFRKVNFRGADLRSTQLGETDLRWVDLRGADLRGSRWTNVRVFGVLWIGARADATTVLPFSPEGARLRGVVYDE